MDKSTSHKYRTLYTYPVVFSTQTGAAATWNRLPLTSLSNDINFQVTKSRAVQLNHEAHIKERDWKISLNTVWTGTVLTRGDSEPCTATAKYLPATCVLGVPVLGATSRLLHLTVIDGTIFLIPLWRQLCLLASITSHGNEFCNLILCCMTSITDRASRTFPGIQ